MAKELGLGSEHYCIDAACASALYVLKLAQDALLSGKADVMLASGSCLPEPFFILTGFSAFQALPLPGGTSIPLQAGSTGLTPGEGGAVMVMKRYADAIRDGDRIYGSLLGVRLDNAGTGLPLKPHKASELRTLRDTYSTLGVAPSTVSMLSAMPRRGAGRSGEWIDMRVFGNGGTSAANSQCGTAGIGQCAHDGLHKGLWHSLVAAGFAGMAKVLLSMQHNVIPGLRGDQSHSRKRRVENHPWPERRDGAPRRAGLSAFGFGGTNARRLRRVQKRQTQTIARP